MLISRRSHEFGLSYGTLCGILHLDLHLNPYKVQLTQELNPTDHSQRRRYMKRMLKEQTKKIFFSDEAHFTMAGYVNK